MNGVNTGDGLSELTDSIKAGRCIAFVGAGFSQPMFPGWRALLTELTKRVRHSGMEDWLSKGALTDRDLEGLGQLIYGMIGPQFGEVLREIFDEHRQRATDEAGVHERLRLLQRIPFHYVLTTNFDGLLGTGAVPCQKSYAQALVAEPRRWNHEDYWQSRSEVALWKDRLLCLHGNLDSPDSIIFSTSAYRKLIHETPAYRAFLRAIFATHNILYLGFSFTDAYVNELRSETLAMLGLSSEQRSLTDFAVLEDVHPESIRHLSAFEGLQVLPFETYGKKCFKGFDAWLKAIHEVSTPEAVLRSRIRGRRILWLDPNRNNNDYGFKVLTGRDDAQALGATVVEASTVEEAMQSLAAPFDVVISCWGHRERGESVGLELLGRIRQADVRVPVVIFASGAHREINRPAALCRGALAYAHRWGDLFGVLDELFSEL